MNKLLSRMNLRNKLVLLMIVPFIGYIYLSIGFLNKSVTEYEIYKIMNHSVQENSQQSFLELLELSLITSDTNDKEIREILKDKIDSLYTNLLTHLLLIIVILCLTITVFIGVFFNIIYSIRTIKSGLNNFFKYLTSTEKSLDIINLDSQDGFGDMAREVNNNITIIKDGLIKDNEVITEAKFVSNMVGNGFLVYRIESSANNLYINELKDTFNDMIESLRINIVKSFSASLSYASRDFTHKVEKNEVGGIINTMIRCLNMTGNNISEFLALVNKNGETLDIKSKLLLSLVESLYSSSTSQAVSLEQTAASVEEITSNISDTSKKANNMLEIAKSTKEYANSGVALVKNTQNSMLEINDATSAINEAITIIDQIAFQTNILSLNAAVEAATAGEAGKGFAVVAQEVRNLANKSTDAARDIKQLVEVAQNKSIEGKNTSIEMLNSFEKLLGMIEKNTLLVDEVASSNKIQMQNLTQINLTMNNLDKITQETAGIAFKTKQVSLETSTIANSMTKTASLNKYDLDAQKRVSDFKFIQEVNKVKIAYMRYKQWILNQVNGKSKTLEFSCEFKIEIEEWIKDNERNDFSSKEEWESIKMDTESLMTLLIEYAKAMRIRDDKRIIRTSQVIEEILDRVFSLLNEFKENKKVF